MGYKELTINETYESGISDVIEDFYKPVFSHAVRYDRIAGFFSSSCLAIVARGVAEFIANEGRMRLITSPRLNKADVEVLNKFVNDPDSLTAEELGLDTENIKDEFEQNHVKAMGWMLRQGYLEIRLAIVSNLDGTFCTDEEVTETGLFHQKVGIFTDANGDQISFSGSINESATAWVNNDEEFKVFRGWDDSKTYFESDRKRFDELWNGIRPYTKVFDLPTAVKKQLISYSKDFDKESFAKRHYLSRKKIEHFDFNKYRIPLFPFQAEALNLWKHSSGYFQLFEMATGCGKTRTAMAAVSHLMDINPKLVVIVSTPQNTLTRQWISEFAKLDISFDDKKIIDGTNSRWRLELKNLLLRNCSGFTNKIAIFTTHNTASSNDFCDIVSRYNYDMRIAFIGDETHWLGASKLRKALLPIYQYRIGLSATPSRWFDDNGTKLLEQYYGNNHYEFTIADALREVNPLTRKHFLVQYYYYLNKVSLSHTESLEYIKITRQLRLLSFKKGEDADAAVKYDRLLEKRANIIKNAEQKYNELDKIIKGLIEKGELEDLIIFVSPQQKERVARILLDNNVIFHKLTQEEGTSPEDRFNGYSEREYIIKQFKEKRYKALVAIKCLDEGIDIPSACRGILMASSTNPREYIQRIGRVIRQDKGKSFAYLYDMYVDSADNLGSDDRTFDESIREKEKKRIREISANAINSTEITKILLN